MPRGTLAGQLAAMGFADAAQTARLLTGDLGLDVGAADEDLMSALAGSADPDLAVASLARIGRDDLFRAALRADAGLRDRLASVLGASAALGDHLARHREQWRLLGGEPTRPTAGELRAELLAAVGADPEASAPIADRSLVRSGDAAIKLRVAYRRAVLRLAARDLTGAEPLGGVMAGLSDLAVAALEAALAVARAASPEDCAGCRLAVIAMGKCGARELNYVSDIDVIFVAEPNGTDGTDESAALRAATRLARGLIRACSQSTPEGALFTVDPNLRPEGRDGPLVRTLGSHLAYYERWARTWEFQALLKARPVAGDHQLGADYLQALTPLIWRVPDRAGFVDEVREMRQRVLRSLPRERAGRELKVGPGGLRDIEFAVQLLQLVHGRADRSLRVPDTLGGLAALAAGGYVGRADAASMDAAYRFLRAVEHLLQLHRLRRTHTLPRDSATGRRLGRALRRMRPLADREDAFLASDGDPAEDLVRAWRSHSSQARQLHEKLFYRPLLDAVARLPEDAARLTPESAERRLEALGYVDPGGALRHLSALTSGVTRRAAIQRTLLPVLLGWFADSAEPDAGLLAFRQVSEALGATPWYLRLLRDNMAVAQRLATVLASSRYATGLLLRAPEAVAMLAEDAELAARAPGEVAAEARAAARVHEAVEDAIGAVLAFRRRELLRTAMADVLGLAGVEEVGEALTVLAQATIAAALDAVICEVERAHGPLPTRLALIAMGRFGGAEMGFASDADVLFVHDPHPGADEEAAARAAQKVAEGLRAQLTLPRPDPPLRIDAGLRPEGRQGPLVRTLGAYRRYYRRWSVPWETQALLRAEFAAGDAELGREFLTEADHIRYPAGGIGAPVVLEIRRVKARMEAERMPRGVDPALHLKLGPGGLSDVEWVVQLLQLRHASAVPGLRTTRTLAGLSAAADAGLVTAADAAVLAQAWTFAARIRDSVLLVRGRGSDTLPTAPAERAGVARLLGYPVGRAGQLEEDWRRAARRARVVMERLFYG